MRGVGQKGGPRLKAKAMECWGVALFLMYILPKHIEKLGEGGRALLAAGEYLVDWPPALKRADPNPTIGQTQELLDLWKKFVARAHDLGLLIPKVHLTYHQITRMLHQGNPVRYQTFVDESLNTVFKGALKHVHQGNFEARGLVKVEHALRRPELRQRMR